MRGVCSALVMAKTAGPEAVDGCQSTLQSGDSSVSAHHSGLHLGPSDASSLDGFGVSVSIAANTIAMECFGARGEQ
jgi:hypothetical protein